MIKVSILASDVLSFQQEVSLRMLHPKKRTRLLGKLGRHLAKQNRKNIRANKDPYGQAWKQRSKGNKKMMRKIGKQLKTKSNSKEATLYFPGVGGRIASRHHYGDSETWTASKAKKVYGTPDHKDTATRLQATRRQAKRLRELGYTIAAKRKGMRKKPTLKWIVGNISLGQAGAIIRSLKNKTAQTSWEVKLPERQLLGAKSENIIQFIATELER